MIELNMYYENFLSYYDASIDLRTSTIVTEYLTVRPVRMEIRTCDSGPDMYEILRAVYHPICIETNIYSYGTSYALYTSKTDKYFHH